MGPVLKAVPFNAARLEAWPQLLDAFIDSRRGWPFEWGRQDCCTFAADAVQAMTGADPLGPLRGKWKTEIQATMALDKLGGLGGGVIAVLGKPAPAAQARRGDVVLVEIGDVRALGVCLGAVAAAPGPEALAFVPMAEAHLCWRVG